MVRCASLILVSSLPFSPEVLADAENKQSAVKSLSIAEKESSLIMLKLLAEKNRQVINETRDFVWCTQQAMVALEKNDTEAAIVILTDVSKKLAVILDNIPALASVTAEMEADIFDFEGNSNTIKNEVKHVDDLLNDETLQSAFLSVPFYKRLKIALLNESRFDQSSSSLTF